MRRTLLSTAIALAAVEPLPGLSSDQNLPAKDLPAVDATKVTQVAGGGEIVTEAQTPLGDVSHQALAQGREVYKDLQRVLRAGLPGAGKDG